MWPKWHPVGLKCLMAGVPLPPTPFGGAELKLTGTHLVTFRPSERRTVFYGARCYKHVTPTE